MWTIIDKKTGEELHKLSAVTKDQIIAELLEIFEIELSGGKHRRTCQVCRQDFDTTDGRYFKCPVCRGTQKEKRTVKCYNSWCGREFTTYDRRTKQCKYCASRKYFIKVPGMQPFCSVCNELECLKREGCLPLRKRTGGLPQDYA